MEEIKGAELQEIEQLEVEVEVEEGDSDRIPISDDANMIEVNQDIII